MRRAFCHWQLVVFVSPPLCSESVVTDILQGVLVVGSTLCAFVSLVWLREQVTHGGGPEWLEDDARRAGNGAADGAGGAAAPAPAAAAAAAAPAAAAAGQQQQQPAAAPVNNQVLLSMCLSSSGQASVWNCQTCF